jgi:hypothetical protein
LALSWSIEENVGGIAGKRGVISDVELKYKYPPTNIDTTKMNANTHILSV